VIEGAGETLSAAAAPRVSLTPVDRIGTALIARIGGGNTFGYDQIRPGTWFVDMMGLQEGMYISSVLDGGKEVGETGVDITEGESKTVTVNVRSDGAKVHGTIETSKSLAGPRAATVVLVPDPLGLHSWRRQRSAVTDQFGKFLINGIEPGQYRVYALRGLDYREEESPDFASRYKEAGKPLMIVAGADLTIRLEALEVQYQEPAWATRAFRRRVILFLGALGVLWWGRLRVVARRR
jgi:hypothetical protein